MRTCKRCGGEVPATRRSNALYCSDQCGQRTRSQSHYSNNPEKYKEKRERHKDDKLGRYMWSRAKYRSKRSGVPFNIDHCDIVIPAICPVLGIPIRPAKGHGGHDDNSPSLDRIIPSLGYVKGNVRVISQRANLLKSNATVEELLAVLSDLRRLAS